MGPPRQEQLQPDTETSSPPAYADTDTNAYQSSPPFADESLHDPSLNHQYEKSSPPPAQPSKSAVHPGTPNKHAYSPHASSAPSYPTNESPINPNAIPPSRPPPFSVARSPINPNATPPSRPPPPPSHVADPHTNISTGYPVQEASSHQPELPQWPQPPSPVRPEPNPEPPPIVKPQQGYPHQPELPQWPPPAVRPEPNPEPPIANPQPNPKPYPEQPIVAPQMGTWTTGLFSCHEDPTNCLVTAFCPCITFGQIAEIVDQGQTTCGTGALIYSTILLCCWIPCIYSCSYRTKLRAKYNLDGAPIIDTLIHCALEHCALCQEYRELANRGLDPAIGWVGNLSKYQQQQQAAMAPPSNQAMYR